MTKKQFFVREIELPQGITASFSDGIVSVKSKNSEVKKKFSLSEDYIRVENHKLIIQTKKSTKTEKKTIGSVVAHLKNMINGVVSGHKYILKICSGHFPMNVVVSNNQLVIKNFFGEKVPRKLEIKLGVKVTVEGDNIHVESIDKDLASQVSADIEQLTRRPGFDTRVFMDGIYIINKDGKELK